MMDPDALFGLVTPERSPERSRARTRHRVPVERLASGCLLYRPDFGRGRDCPPSDGTRPPKRCGPLVR